MPQLMSHRSRRKGINRLRRVMVTPPSTPSDVYITVNRAGAVARAASNRFLMGFTITHNTIPSGNQATAVANMKSKMAAINWDLGNMHNHLFGAVGPWTNDNKNAGETYASRANWAWASWDARLQHVRDMMGTGTELIVSLLPPGWMKMDGGTLAQWNADDNVADKRVTDAHVADMVSIAKAIALRHADVKYFSVFNEQKGNFTPHSDPGMADHGLSGVMDYVFETIYIEAVRAGLDAVGATAVELFGPYHVLEANGVDVLAAAYAGAGFPQPAGAANLGTNKYHQTALTGAPLRTRNVTFLDYYLANTAAATRDNWLAVDWKTYGSDNEQANWNVLNPWRNYLYEAFSLQIDAVKALSGLGSSKIIAMEQYGRKVDDLTNLPSDAEQGVMCAEMLRRELIKGVKADLRWAPEQGGTLTNKLNMFTSTTKTLANGGGVQLPAYDAHKFIADNFRGVDVYDTVSTDDKTVTAVCNATKTLLINLTSDQQLVSINGGGNVVLAGYEMKLVTE